MYREFYHPSKRQSENQRKRKERRTLMLTANKESCWAGRCNIDTNQSWQVWNGPQRHGKGARRAEKFRSNWEYLDNSIHDIGHNTEKSPGDLRRLAVTQTPMKDHQLTLMWKTLKKYHMNKTEK